MAKPFTARVMRAPKKRGEWMCRVTARNGRKSLFSETYKRKASAMKPLKPLDPAKCEIVIDD